MNANAWVLLIALALTVEAQPAEASSIFADRFEMHPRPSIIEDHLPAALMQVLAPDLDGDNHADIVSADQTGTIRWYRNLGKTFAPAQIISTQTGRPFFVDAGDANGDGKIDLLICDNSDNHSRLLLINNTHFTLSIIADAIPLGVFRAYFVDFDLDGDQDILAASDTAITWYANLGHGNYAPGQVLQSATEYYNLDVADFDGKARPDLVVSSALGSQVYLNSQGVLAAPISLNSAISGYIAAADLNADGLADVLVPNVNQQIFTVFLNHGDGQFGAVQSLVLNQANLQNLPIAFSHFDHDQSIDLVFAQADAGLLLHRGLGDGRFAAASLLAEGMDFRVIAPADIDADGDADLIWFGMHGGNRRLGLLWNPADADQP